MKRIPVINWPTVALVGMIMVAINAVGEADPMAAPGPAVVATVDLEAAINKSVAATRMNAELEALGASLEATDNQLKEEIQMLQEDLAVFAPGSESYMKTERQLLWKANSRRAHLEYGTRVLNVEKARVLRELYLQVKVVVEQIANQNNYDVVFVNDAIQEVPEEATDPVGSLEKIGNGSDKLRTV